MPYGMFNAPSVRLFCMGIRMLYVISGHMRTGTSMMMAALEVGGMDAEYRQSRDVMKNHFADEHYDPNVGGLYELEGKDYKAPDFPKQYDGKLIKGLNACIVRMAVMKNGIQVVFMRRDAEEIRQSFDAFFGRQLNSIDRINSQMELFIERILNRRDVKTCHVFWYREVVEQPLHHFKILADAGWPIDPQKASDVVDPKYCRFKLENLTVGVY